MRTEADLAKGIVTWLYEHHWQVYQEVQPRAYGKVADIVATQNNLIWVIECKTSFSLAVIHQAMRWRGHAHYISVAVPFPTANNHNEYSCAQEIVRKFGIGQLAVGYGYDEILVHEKASPLLHRKISNQIKLALREEQKTFAPAGNNQSLRYTPFRATCNQVIDAVRRNPGIEIKQLLATIKTHYQSTSTARSCLIKWIEFGQVPGVRLQREGRNQRLFPVEESLGVSAKGKEQLYA